MSSENSTKYVNMKKNYFTEYLLNMFLFLYFFKNFSSLLLCEIDIFTTLNIIDLFF